eukprot:1137459-Prymnesium_polylepis.1
MPPPPKTYQKRPPGVRGHQRPPARRRRPSQADRLQLRSRTSLFKFNAISGAVQLNKSSHEK